MQPDYLNTKNNRKVITFDGANDRLEDLNIPLPSNMTVFAVVENDFWESANTQYIFLSANNRYGLLRSITEVDYFAKSIVSFGDGQASGTPPRTAGSYGAQANGSYMVLKVTLSSTSSNIRIDGANIILDLSVTGSVNDVGLSIGGRTQRWDGRMAELLIYDSDLSAGDVNTIESYLNIKWAVF